MVKLLMEIITNNTMVKLLMESITMSIKEGKNHPTFLKIRFGAKYKTL